MKSLDNYIKNMKEELNKNIFSPSFLRLANLYFINEQYEECINTCTTGLKIYPDYLSAKLTLLKALIKLEYIAEADTLFNEIESRIPNQEITDSLRTNLTEIKEKPMQEKIFYPEKSKQTFEYKDFEKSIGKLNKLTQSIEFRELEEKLDNPQKFFSDKKIKEAFDKYINELKNLKLNFDSENDTTDKNNNDIVPEQDSIMSRIKIVTETIADIYARQGLIKEAFDAYTILLRAGHKNKKRILEKISELERRM